MMKGKMISEDIRLGFADSKGSVLTKRTIMLKELSALFDYVGSGEIDSAEFQNAVIEDNCTGKRSGATRNYTYTYLQALYALDPSVVLFQGLRYFWQRDPESRPMLALLSAFSRDPIIRETLPFILKQPENVIVTKDACKKSIQKVFQDRFGENMTNSLVRNLLAAWKQAGYLEGYKTKIRKKPILSSGSVAYALFLGYLQGQRGDSLFESQYCKLLDYQKGLLIDKAAESSRKGWIVLKQIGSVIEVLFPNLITTEIEEILREQN